MDGGDLAINFNRTNLKMTGDIQLGETPVSVAWTEKFKKGGNSRLVHLAGRVRDFGNIGFGLPEFDFIAGPGDTNIVIRTLRQAGDIQR